MKAAIPNRRHPARIATLLLAATAAAVTGGTGVAKAATCAEIEVSAKGEIASFKWLALVKARGNWRSKVRSLPKLGAEYANYGRAIEQVERCISDQKTTVCTVTARPCRN